MSINRKLISTASAVIALVLTFVVASVAFAAGLDGTAQLSTLGADLTDTVTTNLGAILTVGFIVIAAFAGLSFLFRGGNKASKGRG